MCIRDRYCISSTERGSLSKWLSDKQVILMKARKGEYVWRHSFFVHDRCKVQYLMLLKQFWCQCTGTVKLPLGNKLNYFPGGVLPEKLGRGVWPASQNSYPIYDQSLRFMTWPKIGYPIYDLIWVGLLLLVLSSVRSRRLTEERKAKRGWKEGDMIKK